MSKRGLNIYHRKDGRYEGRYVDGYLESGKTKYHSIYGKTYTEVKEKLLKIKADTTAVKRDSGLTVKMLFAEWLSAKLIQTKASTYANYAFKVEKHLMPSFGCLKIEELTPKCVYDFIIEKQSYGLSNKYISDLIIVLKNMTKYATRIYHCVNNIAEVELPKKEKKELELLDKNEQNSLKTALLCNMDCTKLSVLIAYYTGIRVGELCGLRWSDIDLMANTICIERTVQRIRSSKSHKTELIVTSPKSHSSVRTIPLPPFLVDMIKAFKPSGRNAYIVTGSERIPEPRTMQYRFKSILAKANIRDINFHSLRHMFATNCIELGFDVKTLSEILGHSTVEITLNRYVHSSMERKKACMNLLDLKTA